MFSISGRKSPRTSREVQDEIADCSGGGYPPGIRIQRQGENITYYINNYPVNQTDHYGAGTDSVSGSTIITDGTLGLYTQTDLEEHIVGGTLIFTCPQGTTSAPLIVCRTSDAILSFDATPTQLLLPYGDALVLYGYDAEHSDEMGYQRFATTTPRYFCSAQYNGSPGWFGSSFDGNPTDVPGSIAANDPWVIATRLPGDANGDGTVNGADLNTVLSNYNQTGILVPGRLQRRRNGQRCGPQHGVVELQPERRGVRQCRRS